MGGLGSKQGCAFPKDSAGAALGPMSNDPNTGFAGAGGWTGASGTPAKNAPGYTKTSTGAITSSGGIGALFGGGGNTNDVQTNVLNNVIANITISAITNCQENADVGQRITTGCTNSLPPGFSGDDFNNNAGCVAARTAWTNFDNRRQAFENDLAANVPGYKPTLSTTGMAKTVQNDLKYDPTLAACEPCVFQSFSQNANVYISESCQSEVNIVNNLQNSMEASIKQMLTNKEDYLGQLGGILSGSKDCISSDLANRMNTRIDDSFVSNLISNMRVQQVIAVGGTSIYVDRFSQSINANTTASLVFKTNLTNNLYNSDETNVTANLYHSNDTIGELAGDLSKSLLGSAQILSSIIWRLFIIIAAIMVFLLIAFLIISVTDKETASKLVDLAAGNQQNGTQRYNNQAPSRY